MLLPLETIAIILYLASITKDTPPPSISESILYIAGALLLCLLVVSLEALILTRRRKLYTKASRFLCTSCTSFNKLLSAGITIFLLDHTRAYNLYNAVLPQLEPSYALQNITGMIIYIIITLFTWLPWYYIHKRITPGTWSMRSYLIYKFRYTFFILGIWLPGIILTEYIDSKDSIIKGNDIEIYSSILFIALAWIFPVFLRKFWGCKELKDHELRNKIETLAARASVKVKSICLWNLGGKSLPNAAMVGFLPPFRFLFISHGLIDKLPEDEVLGVVAHELGHLKKHHILFYLIMSVSLLSAVEPIIYAIVQNRIYTIAGLVGLFFIYIRFIFAWFSRRFEREADLFSLELIGDYRPLSRGLERIGIACGNIRNESSWHHYGISERVRFLEEAFHNQQIKNNFKLGLIITKTLSIIAFALLMSYTYFLRPADNTNEITIKNNTQTLEKGRDNHKEYWLEINAVLPDENISQGKNL